MNDRDFQMYLNFEQYRLADRLFENMDPEILRSLNPAQRRDLTRALVRSFLSPSPKFIDLRWRFPLLRRKRYLQVLIGSDTREGEPRYYSCYLTRSRWLANTVFLLVVLLTLFCAGVGLEHLLATVF